MKLQSVGIHVALLKYIVIILSQSDLNNTVHYLALCTNTMTFRIYGENTYLISGLYINIFFNLSLRFGQLTKKSTCLTQSLSCPEKLIKITKTKE